jgi:hypothetical protein
LQLRR